MRSWLTATLIFVAGTAAQAQMVASPPVAGVKPKAVATVPIRPPGLQTPTDTANAMAQAERLALQSDLAWVGEYNGAITGEVSERMVNAIKEFQKSRGGKQTGVLNPQERGDLAATARRRQENVGWKIQTDPGTGVRLGIPTKLVPASASAVHVATMCGWSGSPPNPCSTTHPPMAVVSGRCSTPSSSPVGTLNETRCAGTTPRSARAACRTCAA